MNPIPCFFDYFKNHRLLSTVVDNFLNLLDDMVGIIASDACDGFYLILDGRIWILFSVLEHKIDLIFKLIALIWLAHNIKLIRRSFLDNMELIQIDMTQGCKLILLISKMLNFNHNYLSYILFNYNANNQINIKFILKIIKECF